MRTLLTCSMLMLGCAKPIPCLSCPSVAGEYQVTWGSEFASEDGGASACVGPRPSGWNLTATDAGITAAFDGVTLQGTIFVPGSLSLFGTGPGVTNQIRSTVTFSGEEPDAGVSLNGTLTTRTIVADDAPCESTAEFTAQRAAR